MIKGLTILIAKGDGMIDISQLIQSVKWRGRKGSSSRTLTVTIIDDDGYQHARSGINVEDGNQCIFTYNGAELFRGLIMSTTQSDRKQMVFTAYDTGIYMANNKDTFTYENKTATEIFTDCCNRFGIEMGEVAKCTYKIPELTKSKTTAFDAICDALSLDFDATGVRHYVSSQNGKLSLLTRRENILQWVIESGQNLTGYNFTNSIENIKTKVRMYSKEGTVVGERSNSALEAKIGVFTEIDEPDESLTEAQLKDLIDSILAEKSKPEKALSLSAIGIPDVISGIGVFVIIPELNISRTFYVDEDAHTFEDGIHNMELKLTFASDIGIDSGDDSSAEYNIGDIVQFNGGYHYVSSSAGSPTGSECAPGPAKITLHAPGSKHPWHLINTDGTTRVYGWVDEGSFS